MSKYRITMTETHTTSIVVEADTQLEAMLSGSELLFAGGEILDTFVVDTDVIGDPTFSAELVE